MLGPQKLQHPLGLQKKQMEERRLLRMLEQVRDLAMEWGLDAEHGPNLKVKMKTFGKPNADHW